MKLVELWQERTRPTISFEVFPARTPKGEGKLSKVLNKLSALEPDFFAVTSGAGGSTRSGSLALARQLKETLDQEVLAYFNGYGQGPPGVEAALSEVAHLGIQNMLLVRGDAPRGEEEFEPQPESFSHASDLLAYAASLPLDLCFGGACYPEGHKEAPSLERDLEFIKLKQDRGAAFFVANYFYDNRRYHRFLEQARAAGVTAPIIPGVMPIFSIKMMENLAALCGAEIPDPLKQSLASLPADDKGALARFGVQYAVDQCRDLLESGVPGLHFYTMNKSKAVVGVVTQLREEGLL